MDPHRWQRQIDRAELLALSTEPATLTEHITAVTEYLGAAIETDTDPASRLPRWGEVLNLLVTFARADWARTTGTDVDFREDD